MFKFLKSMIKALGSLFKPKAVRKTRKRDPALAHYLRKSPPPLASAAPVRSPPMSSSGRYGASIPGRSSHSSSVSHRSVVHDDSDMTASLLMLEAMDFNRPSYSAAFDSAPVDCTPARSYDSAPSSPSYSCSAPDTSSSNSYSDSSSSWGDSSSSCDIGSW